MLVTFTIGLIVFIITFALSVLVCAGAVFKNVGITNFGIIPMMLFLIAPLFFLIMELAMLHYAAHAWGIAYFFIAMNAGFFILQYFFVVGSAIFTKNSIYRLTGCLIWKRYAYNDVIGYTMKKTSGRVNGKFQSREVVTFEVELFFNDYKSVSFSVNDKSDKKVTYIKQLLLDHDCLKKGRIKRKYRMHR